MWRRLVMAAGMVWALGALSYAADIQVHWQQEGCPIVAEWTLLCEPVGATEFEEVSRIDNLEQVAPAVCDLIADLDVGTREGSWVCWMHAIRVETGEVSPASNTRTVTFGTGATTTTTTQVPNTTTTTTPSTPTCGPDESACEQGVAAFCLCGGVDPCLAGEWCAGVAQLCPLTQSACRALLPTTTTASPTTTTTSTSTTTSTTTTTTLRIELQAPVILTITPLP